MTQSKIKKLKLQCEPIKKITNYQALRATQEQLINKFPIAFTFARTKEEALKDLQKKIPLTDPADEYCSIGCGGIIRSSDVAEWNHLTETCDQELTEFLSDPENFAEALKCELSNHEYQFAEDPEPALSALGLDLNTMNADDKKMVVRVCQDYMQDCIKNDWF